MSERKQTPDVLADLLNANPSAETMPAPAAAPPPAPAPRRTRKPAAPRQPAAAAPAPPAQPSAPPQWEYREVIFREYRGWRPRCVDGRERWDWKEAPTMLDYLRQVGAEGWELVSIGPEHNYQKTAYFKRLRDEIERG